MAAVRHRGSRTADVPLGACGAPPAEGAGHRGPEPLPRDPGALPAADLALAQALADVATIGILSERAVHDVQVLNAQLQTALNSRVIIEQAKGVIAHRGKISMDAAFARLRRYARDKNERLVEVARRIANHDERTAAAVLATSADPSPAARRR